MKTNLFLLTMLSVFLISCEDDHKVEVPQVNLKADFTTVDTLYSQQEWIEFQNIGDSVAKYYWEFGDGNSSIERSPKHSYLRAGTYNVKLKIINEHQDCDSITKQIRIGECFAFQIELIHLDEYKYYKKEEFWDEDSTGINALPDIFFEIEDKNGRVYFTSESYYNLPLNSLPLTIPIPNIKIDPWFIGIAEASIFINLQEIDGNKIENIMTSIDLGSRTFTYDSVSHMGEFTIHAGASFKVSYTVK